MHAKAKRRTIGESPFDAVVPRTSKSTVAEPQELKQQKKRITFHLPVELMDHARNAVYWTPGLTMAGLAEQALEKAVAELEKKRGEPFPPRKADLKGGRPVR